MIDLEGDINGNILTLEVADVLALSSTTDTVTVSGDGSDAVVAGGGWTDGGISVGFHTYTQGLATLIVDQDIDQTGIGIA